MRDEIRELMAEGPSIVERARSLGILEPKQSVQATVDHRSRESLSTLVRVTPIRDGQWAAQIARTTRTANNAETAVRRVALEILQRQKRRLNLPGVLADDDSLEVEPVSHGLWKASWRHGR